ncbi:MAG: hypothetical protein N3E41_08705 [Thermofilaceae archaeon]|nr:hypothetical protein [Thermofilaceae archaeon]
MQLSILSQLHLSFKESIHVIVVTFNSFPVASVAVTCNTSSSFSLLSILSQLL